MSWSVSPWNLLLKPSTLEDAVEEEKEEEDVVTVACIMVTSEVESDGTSSVRSRSPFGSFSF